MVIEQQLPVIFFYKVDLEKVPEFKPNQTNYLASLAYISADDLKWILLGVKDVKNNLKERDWEKFKRLGELNH